MKRFVLALAFLLASVSASATDWFVYDATAGAGCTLGQCWQNAYTTLAQDWGSIITPATDTVYVHSAHAQSTASTITITGSTTEGSTLRVNILCVVGDTTGTTPGNLTTACDETVTGFANQLRLTEGLYVYGVDFHSDDGDVWLNGTGTADSFITLEQCTLDLIGTNGNSTVRMGTASAGIADLHELIDTNVIFGSTAQGFKMQNANLDWRGGILTGAQVSLFEEAGGRGMTAVVNLDGVDLSSMGTGEHLVLPTINNPMHINVKNVEVGSGFDWVNGTIDLPDFWIRAYYTEVGTKAAPALQIHFEDLHGEADEDTVRTITAGATSASDGTTDFSWTLDTTTNTRVSFLEPFIGPPLSFWRTGDGTSQTIRFHWADTNGFDDDEVGLNCLIGSNPTDTGSLGEWVTTRPDPLTAGSAHPADSTTWGGTDVAVDFYTDVAASPDKDSLWTCYPWIAVDAERVSFNPRPDPQ